MNEVHGISNVLEHASVGHEQIAMLETFQQAKFDRKGYEKLVHPFLGFKVKRQTISTYFVYLLHLVKKSTRQA